MNQKVKKQTQEPTRKTNHILDTYSTLIPTLNRFVACTKLVHLNLNSQTPMHNGTLSPDNCSCLVFLKESMNSTPKRETSLISPMNGISVDIQPS